MILTACLSPAADLPAMISPELVILRELLEHEPAFVSGNLLAGKLGMSRVGVWMHMGKLREQGFELEAVRSRGYRLVRWPASLNPLLVQAHLKPPTRQPDILCLPEVDSTNDEAERQLASGRATPFVVLARRQTLGRGRFGRVWHSEDNGNLYASFVFRPHLEPGRMQTFTLWMGANLCELVANFCRLQPGIKWPNDLYFEGRKLGGMLTEARIDSDQIRDLVFGLGLNVNSPLAALPAELARQATTLADCTGHPLDLNRLTAAIIGRVLSGLRAVRRGQLPGHVCRPVEPLRPPARPAGDPGAGPPAHHGRRRRHRRRGLAAHPRRERPAAAFSCRRSHAGEKLDPRPRACLIPL